MGLPTADTELLLCPQSRSVPNTPCLAHHSRTITMVLPRALSPAQGADSPILLPLAVTVLCCVASPVCARQEGVWCRPRAWVWSSLFHPLSPYPAPWGSQRTAVLSQLGILSPTLEHPTATAVSALPWVHAPGTELGRVWALPWDPWLHPAPSYRPAACEEQLCPTSLCPIYSSPVLDTRAPSHGRSLRSTCQQGVHICE